ncbi:MAG: hypothetical protein ACT4PT_08145 [Methanobacteriota archaeon]
MERRNRGWVACVVVVVAFAVAAVAPGGFGTVGVASGTESGGTGTSSGNNTGNNTTGNNTTWYPYWANVTLRVAPSGFAVPSHWAVGNKGEWIIDPANDTRFNHLDGVAGCRVTVFNNTTTNDSRMDGGEVLDAAVKKGCIKDWGNVSFGSLGRLVNRVDNMTELGWPASYWWIQLNGTASPVGIDFLNVTNETSLEFVHVLGP